MPKDYDDSNWRREYQAMKVLSERATFLLNNGAQSWSSAMWLGAMYNDWKKKRDTINLIPKKTKVSINPHSKNGTNQSMNDHSMRPLAQELGGFLLALITISIPFLILL